MKKLFDLVCQNFTKNDYKSFKTHLNSVYSGELNRPALKPSKLDLLASKILGANNPSVMADALSVKAFEAVCDDSVLSVGGAGVTDLIPLADIEFTHEGLNLFASIGVNFHHSAPEPDGDSGSLTVSLLMYSDDDTVLDLETPLCRKLRDGGFYLADYDSPSKNKLLNSFDTVVLSMLRDMGCDDSDVAVNVSSFGRSLGVNIVSKEFYPSYVHEDVRSKLGGIELMFNLTMSKVIERIVSKGFVSKSNASDGFCLNHFVFERV